MNNGKKMGRSLAAPAFLLPYSPKCVEGQFRELRLSLVLGSTHASLVAFGYHARVACKGTFVWVLR